MTKQEAATIVRTLVAAFPRDNLAAASTALYVQQIERLDEAGVAREAAQLLIDNVEKFPTIAEFRQEYFALRRRQAAANMTEEEHGEPVPPPDFVRELFQSFGKRFPRAEVQRRLEEMDELPDGRCDDCGKHQEEETVPLIQYYKLRLCHRHATLRMRAHLSNPPKEDKHGKPV